MRRNVPGRVAVRPDEGSGTSAYHPVSAIGQAHSIAQKPTCKVNGRLSETSALETAPAGAAVRQAEFVARRGGGICRRPCARQVGRERRDREPAGSSETQGPGAARAAGKAPLIMPQRESADRGHMRQRSSPKGPRPLRGSVKPRVREDSAKTEPQRTGRNRARSRPKVGRRRPAPLTLPLRLTSMFL